MVILKNKANGIKMSKLNLSHALANSNNLAAPEDSNLSFVQGHTGLSINATSILKELGSADLDNQQQQSDDSLLNSHRRSRSQSKIILM
jgi:hypothetical protein